ncbi:MAG: deoxyribose-phosphate aldolase [Rhizobacter sp.]|nr:deoxyribose-phosphate aldolase [Ferruginibacter sp.]
MIDIRNFENRELAKYIQFTNTSPNVTRQGMVKHAELSAEHGFNAAMVPMCWVPLVKDILAGTGVKVATFFGFGMGYESSFSKLAMMRECVALGADEVDYEPNMSWFLSGMYDEFRNEAILLKAAAQGMPIKPMLEFGMLKTVEEKIKIAQLIDEAELEWIKNSSGGGPFGIAATPEDIKILFDTVSSSCKVKASGKVNSFEKMVSLFDAGAVLVGTSSGIQILNRTLASATNY